MPVKFLVFVDHPLPRIRYVLDTLSLEYWELPYDWTSDPHLFASFAGPKFAYTQAPPPFPTPWIEAADLLFEETIQAVDLQAYKQEHLLFLFPSQHPDSLLAFDPLAAIFYLLSRYEEYLPYPPDSHGRFSSQHSILAQQGCLQEPVVERWVQLLAQSLLSRFPDFHPAEPRYSFLPTYDIDLAWAFKHRPGGRQLASALRNIWRGDWHLERRRWQTLRGKVEDPFFTFSRMDAWHDSQHPPTLFFLLGKYGRHDKNVSPQTPALRRLICEINEQWPVGIHPSYQSNVDFKQLRREVETLEQIIGRPIKHSRQHYLKLTFPNTYRHLLDLGIEYDYTMGYADQPGFRAGTARPFLWYDLERNCQTSLRIVPFQIMDVTLRQSQSLEQARATSLYLLEQTRRFGGQFCTLWHNNTLSDLPPFSPEWSAFYQELLLEALP